VKQDFQGQIDTIISCVRWWGSSLSISQLASVQALSETELSNSRDLNITAMQTSTSGNDGPPHDLEDPIAGPLSAAGSLKDPVMRDALRLMEAFLAIEDAASRAALITLAEGLVSYDWVRKAQGRR
jgi:hypothetical protein